MAKATTLGFTPQSIESYEQYFEIIFDEEKNLGAIEKARGEINEALGITDKLPVYLSVFTMNISDNVFGEIDGETVDYSDNENRSRAVRYIIDRYIEAFNAQGYENLYLAGFYWENEAISVDTPAEDIELVKQSTPTRTRRASKPSGSPTLTQTTITTGISSGSIWPACSPTIPLPSSTSSGFTPTHGSAGSTA